MCVCGGGGGHSVPSGLDRVNSLAQKVFSHPFPIQSGDKGGRIFRLRSLVTEYLVRNLFRAAKISTSNELKT